MPRRGFDTKIPWATSDESAVKFVALLSRHFHDPPVSAIFRRWVFDVVGERQTNILCGKKTGGREMPVLNNQKHPRKEGVLLLGLLLFNFHSDRHISMPSRSPYAKKEHQKTFWP
jgi:hypothetical protein